MSIILIPVTLVGIGFLALHIQNKEVLSIVKSEKAVAYRFVKYLNEVRKIISSLNQRFLDLETLIRLQKSDSSRLVEWLDKERALRDSERVEFLKALAISERESKIIELGERLKLIKIK